MVQSVSHLGPVMWSASGLHERPKLSESSDSTESFLSDLQTDPRDGQEQPLFLQLNCSIHSKSKFTSIAVKLLPTCFTEIAQNLEDYNLTDSGLKVTLDIICLKLPKEVLEVNVKHIFTIQRFIFNRLSAWKIENKIVIEFSGEH